MDERGPLVVKSLSHVRLFAISVHGILQARILEWVSMSFSRGSSQPRNQTRVSHIAGRRFILWATREAHKFLLHLFKKKKMVLYSSARVWNEETSFSLSTFWIPSYLQKHLHLPYVCMYQGLSQVNLFVTQQTVAHQASLSMEFSRQEYWSGLPFPSPGNLPNPGTEPGSPALQADSLLSEPLGKPLL